MSHPADINIPIIVMNANGNMTTLEDIRIMNLVSIFDMNLTCYG